MTEQEKRAVMLTPDDIETLLRAIRSLESDARRPGYRPDMVEEDAGELHRRLERIYQALKTALGL